MIHQLCEQTYGYRRMYLAVKALGFKCNEKLIRKRMKLLKLKCAIRQKKNNYSKKNQLTISVNHIRKVQEKCKKSSRKNRLAFITRNYSMSSKKNSNELINFDGQITQIWRNLLLTNFSCKNQKKKKERDRGE